MEPGEFTLIHLEQRMIDQREQKKTHRHKTGDIRGKTIELTLGGETKTPTLEKKKGKREGGEGSNSDITGNSAKENLTRSPTK